MAPRPKVMAVPEEVRRELDRWLMAGGFSGYLNLSEWLGEQGFEISHAAVHRYGVQLERKVEAIRLATEQANVIVSASPDDAGAMSLGTLRMAQERLFSLLRASDDGNLKEVTSAARAIADMARAPTPRRVGSPSGAGSPGPWPGAWMFKNFGVKDWLRFAEAYGHPLRIGKYDKGATDDERAVLLRAVRNIASDASAIIPEGMEIDFEGSDGTAARSDLYHVGFDWRDTEAHEHVRSFTIAKAGSLDVLEAGRAEVQRMIEDGIAREESVLELEKRFRELGWWGRQKVRDPLTGEIRTVQLGSVHRVRTILDTNVRTAYARGRWERIERQAEARPYLRYVSVLDDRTRPQHRAWHGTVLPVGHPFWRTHYPPNDWYCRCTVQQLSAADVEEFGFKVDDAPPEGWDRTREWLNKRAKRVYQVPAGIGPGFQFNVGLVDRGREASARLIGKLDATTPAMARAAIGRPWATAAFRKHLQGASDMDWPVAAAAEAVTRAIGSNSRIVRLSSATARKQARHPPDLTPGDYALVQRALDEGELFRIDDRNVTGFLEVDGVLWRAIVKRTHDGSEAYMTTLHKARPNDLRAARRNLEAVVR